MSIIKNGVDLELTRLKTLRRKIKQLHERQINELVNTYREKVINPISETRLPETNLIEVRTPDTNNYRSTATTTMRMNRPILSTRNQDTNKSTFQTSIFQKTIPHKELIKQLMVADNKDDNMKLYLEQSIKKETKKNDKTIQYWTKVKDTNVNYHMQKKGFTQMLKEIQGSTQNVSKIRGGTSIFEDFQLKDAIVNCSNAPILTNKETIKNLQNVISVSPAECKFQRVLSQQNRGIIKIQDASYDSHSELSKVRKGGFDNLSVREMQKSSQQIRSDFNDIVFPSNPALFIRRGNIAERSGTQTSKHVGSPLSGMSKYRGRSPKMNNENSMNLLSQQIGRSTQMLSFMKDYCKKEQIFFNENERIKFLKLRSKNHFQLYKKAFENTTLLSFGDTNLDSTDQEFKRRISGLQSSNQNSLKKLDKLNGIADNIKLNQDLMSTTQSRFKKLDPIQRSLSKRSPVKDGQLVKTEFEKFSRVLDSGKIILKKKRKGRKESSNDPINKLSQALKKYKDQREKSEDQLFKVMEKVKIDKSILLREKLESIWNDQLYQTDFDAIKFDLQKQKIRREEVNSVQKDQYCKILQFIKERDALPVAEEKQILDGIKLVLDNGYILRDQELVQIFDLIGLKGKIKISEENLTFLEFIYLVAKLFKIDLRIIQEYFLIQS